MEQQRSIRAAVFCAAMLIAGPLLAAEYDATLEWARRVELGTLVSGVVQQVDARPGDRVDKGAILLRLDSRGFAAELQRARAEVSRTQKERAEALNEKQRAEELYDRTLLSQHDLELANLLAAQAENAYSEAQAGLTTATLELEYSVMRAPFDALVLERRAERGQTVVASMTSPTLFVLVEAESMNARISLSPEIIDTVKSGAAATVRVGGREYPAKVLYVGLEPDATEQALRYPVLVEFQTAGTLLRAGMPATVELQ